VPHALVFLFAEPHPYLESDHKYAYTLLIFPQKVHLLSLMVNGTALFGPLGLGFNPHCLHFVI
jgi:hypothetical protein